MVCAVLKLLRLQVLNLESLTGFQRIYETTKFVCKSMFVCATFWEEMPKGVCATPTTPLMFFKNLGLKIERRFRAGHQSLNPSMSYNENGHFSPDLEDRKYSWDQNI